MAAFNLSESSELATAQAGHPWHPTKNVILLFGTKFSIPELFQLLRDWNKGDQAKPKIDDLRATLSVAHYILTRLYPGSISDQAPPNLPVDELDRHIKAGSNCFWQFTHLLKLVEKDTPMGPAAVGKKAEKLYAKTLESSKDMDMLREVVNLNYNLVVVQRLKKVMDEETWKKLVYDLNRIDGVNTNLLT